VYAERITLQDGNGNEVGTAGNPLVVSGGSSGVSNPATEDLDMDGFEIVDVEAITVTGTEQRTGVSGGSYVDYNDNAGYLTAGGSDGTKALIKTSGNVGTNYVPTHAAEVTNVAGKNLTVTSGVLNSDGYIISTIHVNSGTSDGDCGLSGPCSSTTSNDNEKLSVVPFAGTISKLTAFTEAAPTAGKSWTYLVYKNGSSTSLTCTIADAANGCSDAVNTVTLAAGDRIGVTIRGTGTPASTKGHGVSVVFVGD